MAITIITALVLAVVSYAVGSWSPLLSYLAIAAAAAGGMIAVWLRDGRQILSPRNVLQIPRYALAKAPMYLRFFTARQRTWIRTERTSLAGDSHSIHGHSALRSATLAPSSETNERG